MSFLKNIFSKKDEQIKSYSDFWNWFQANGKTFFNVIKSGEGIEERFFDKLALKLEELQDGYFYLAGMYDDNTAELILTADGNIKNMVFVEELVQQAPQINGWRFTALKPALDIGNVNIDIAGYNFNSENMFFYSNDFADYPDEIDISVAHLDLTNENRKEITNGVYIFLDNYLGELDFVNNIDNIKVIGKYESEKELVPISKLKDFLNWRQKEFIEKYDGVRYNTSEDEHAVLEAESESGNKLLAVVNTQLLNWDRKASHPWIAVIIFKYNGSSRNGMPGDNDYASLNQIEEIILQQLSAQDGYLHIGRQTANGERDVYFACKDFREPSKVFFKVLQDWGDIFEIEYGIYKDKYWQTFERFRVN